MANNNVLDTLVNGTISDVPETAKQRLEQSIRAMNQTLESAKTNRTTSSILGRSDTTTVKVANNSLSDSQIYTSISEMINGDTTDFGGFGTILDNLYAKNKRYFSIIKDYEIMPILIPQINRVLMFLVNECLSPDIQHDVTFRILYTGTTNELREPIQKDIDGIKKEMKLDNLLRDVYTNRYKLGNEYYLVLDYQKTFNHMADQLRKKRLNETATGKMTETDMDYLDHIYEALTETVNDFGCTLRIQTITESVNPSDPKYTGTKDQKEAVLTESNLDLSFRGMNIVIERSCIAHHVASAHAELMSEAYSGYRMDSIMDRLGSNFTSLNEAVVDTSKLDQIVDHIRKKHIQRCTIERLDPAKVFKLKISGRTIGYFHVTDINESTSNVVNFAQALKDQLLKARTTNVQSATKTAEEVISHALAEKIINTFDPNIGVNRIEDIDLLHDFVKNNEIYRGNKRITFYYEDEIYDCSRSDGSLLTNGVFFTKLYATLLLNNIITKVLRGRGRQIHTVRMGASPAVQRYIQNAMAALTMPENNLGAMHGSFEQIMNPFNASSDIIIPTEDDTERFITTDYVPGQDVDMNEEFLKTLLNAIISSFGLDSAVIDATTGNLQFARTLSMESLQIANSIRNEQQDLHDSWERLCLRVLEIMGSENTKKAIENDQIKVEFFEPKSMIIQSIIDDLNNAKSQAEAIADIIPEFNEDGSDAKRAKFIYGRVKELTNIDWGEIEKLLAEVQISQMGDQMEAKIREIIREYEENTKEVAYGDENGDGIVTDEDVPAEPGDEFEEPAEGAPGEGEEGEEEALTPEEEELMASDDEEEEEF